MSGALGGHTPDNQTLITARLMSQRSEHRTPKAAISALPANLDDDLELERLQQRKLQLRDCIALLENLLIPDEPA